jgi:maltooligosyltrehalose trehalohydrolase
VDALRIDAVHAMVDHSAKHILEELAEEAAALEGHLGRPLALVAESDLNDPRIVRPREAGGYGFDAQWCDDFRHSLHTVLTGENMGFHGDFGTLDDLATALRQGYVYCGQFSRYRGRCHGRPPEGLPGNRLLGYMQNHDQVGNRAQGERSSHLMSVGKLKIAAAVVLTSPLTPMLFQGEEWGASTPFLYFTDHTDPKLAQLVSEGRRKDFAPFGWDFDEVPDPQEPQTFERSKLDWDEPARAPHADMLDWHRRLLRLRRERPELTDPRMERVHTAFDADRQWLVFRRGGVRVACNFGNVERAVAVEGGERLSVALASDDTARLEEGHVVLPPESVAVLILG